MMLPKSVYQPLPTVSVQTSRDYRMDPNSKRIIGFTDGLDAVRQAYEKMFLTERFAYEIYTSLYGIEVDDLIGQDFDFVRAAVTDRIRDALRSDDRTISIPKIDISLERPDAMVIEVLVRTTEGDVDLRKELIL